MSWLITGSQPIPAVIGESFGGGYFAGYISHTADGNATHALIVASRVPSGGQAGASGSGYNTGFTTSYAWATGAAASNSVTTGVAAGAILTAYNERNTFDGAVNVNVMKVNSYGIASYPAAKYIDDLNAGSGFGGQTDWYLPSRLELDIAYFNLKPATTSTEPNSTSWGINAYSVPKRDANFTTAFPMQTGVALFVANGAECFPSNSHWSSSQAGTGVYRGLDFAFGNQFNDIGSVTNRVRAFRKIAL